MNKDEVITLMRNSKSLKEWNDNCILLKSKCNGEYPIFWTEETFQKDLKLEIRVNYNKSKKKK